ncbi:MAG: PKD domain-containing protein [Gemmataceae bacterium]
MSPTLRRTPRALRLEPLETRLVPALTAAITPVGSSDYTEGAEVALTATVTDASDPTYAWTVTRGLTVVATGDAADFSFTPDDHGPYSVSLDVTDGGAAAGDFQLLSVRNVDPVLDLSGPDAGTAGQALTFQLAATDPSPVDQAAGFIFRIDWDGDGQVDETVPATPGVSAVQLTHTYAAGGTFNVQVTAEDKDGGLSSASLAVTVGGGTGGTGVTFAEGVLTVNGTSGNDVILFIPAGRPKPGGRPVAVSSTAPTRARSGASPRSPRPARRGTTGSTSPAR